MNYIRDRRAQKRGGGFQITSLATEPRAAPDDISAQQIEELNEALQVLEKIDARLAECVDLKFFCGHSFEEIAVLRNVSERTVRRDWEKARLLLNGLIDQED
jgi:RNA polymerase sigma factor (sigma-70 family)